jgi:hypothetical protein
MNKVMAVAQLYSLICCMSAGGECCEEGRWRACADWAEAEG